VIAESVLLKHQLLIVNRSRRRAPYLLVFDRLIRVYMASRWAAGQRKIPRNELFGFSRETEQVVAQMDKQPNCACGSGG
jgi:hypothetical protein